MCCAVGGSGSERVGCVQDRQMTMSVHRARFCEEVRHDWQDGELVAPWIPLRVALRRGRETRRMKERESDIEQKKELM